MYVNNECWEGFINRYWLGKLKLNFSLKNERSVLTECRHFGPFLVQRCFYSDSDNCLPHVYLLHPPGGMVGGDKLVLNVYLEPGSQALLTTPGATKFYRTNGMYAIQTYTFKLGSNSALEWMPQSSIFFSKAKVKMNTTFILGEGAKIISCDMLCFNNPVLNEYFLPELVDMYLRVSLPYSVGLRERLRLNSKDCSVKFHGFRISAVLFAAPSDEKILCQVRNIVNLMNNDHDCQIGGVTLLDTLLIVRLFGNDNQKLRKLLYDVWCVVRPFVMGKKAVAPRIWST